MNEENLEMQVHRYIDEVLLLRVENKKLKEKLEKIKEKCKEFISKCNECENPDTTIDCIDCTTGGKAVASYKILNIIEDIKGAEE